ncbi:MAG TPA: GNAT family N-acetyltransferase [bacterium]|nr:GNAT family N-acetyltransferase [bacterium]HPN45216.1 GNAT family N-acetyltransferase [bacterium]
MNTEIIIEPMSAEFPLWRCLHNGPLTSSDIDAPPRDPQLNFSCYRARNCSLLSQLTRVYGACAIIARQGEQVIAMLRFYPTVVWNMPGAGGLCLQQDAPAGPADNIADSDFPALDKIADKTLWVHCMMTGDCRKHDKPLQRKGIGSRMVKTLIQWAGANGWEHIEAEAFEDLPMIYEVTGCAGHYFWEKLGFRQVDRYPHPDLRERNEFVLELEKQALAAGIPPERAIDKLIMRYDLH